MRLGAVFSQAEFTRVDAGELIAFAPRLEGGGYDQLLLFDHNLGADAHRRQAGRATTITRTLSLSR
jgi:hypothetical protein